MAKAKTEEEGQNTESREVCGVVMPISAMGSYDASHWIDVRKIIYRAVEEAGMSPQIVSDSLESDVIQERIVLNLYDNPIVICDVSGLNPNVMFELGMRLTFKKPTIIITDDVQSLPFDTRIIEHLPYPRDLHFHQMEEFISILSKRITVLREKLKYGTYKSFIESFGSFETAAPDKEAVPIDKYVLDRLDRISASLRHLERNQSPQTSDANVNRILSSIVSSPMSESEKIYAVRFRDHDELEASVTKASEHPGVDTIYTNFIAPDKAMVKVSFLPSMTRSARRSVDEIFSKFIT